MDDAVKIGEPTGGMEHTRPIPSTIGVRLPVPGHIQTGRWRVAPCRQREHPQAIVDTAPQGMYGRYWYWGKVEKISYARASN